MWGLFPRINCNSEDDVAFLHLGDVGTCQLEREIAWSKRVFKKSNLRGSDKQTERSELICVKGNTSVLRLYIYPILYVCLILFQNSRLVPIVGLSLSLGPNKKCWNHSQNLILMHMTRIICKAIIFFWPAI